MDPVKFNILDYFEVISNPMDLGTVRKKISHNCYHSAKEFVDDMNLIWINCYKYNGDGHDISKCAKELESNFKEYSSSYGLAKYMEEENAWYVEDIIENMLSFLFLAVDCSWRLFFW